MIHARASFTFEPTTSTTNNSANETPSASGTSRRIRATRTLNPASKATTPSPAQSDWRVKYIHPERPLWIAFTDDAESTITRPNNVSRMTMKKIA